MSTFVVLGDADAAPRLVTATLNDFLDTHLEVTPDDDFVIVIAVRNPPRPAIKHVIEWCQKAGIYYTIVASSDRVKMPEGVAEFTVDSQFLVKAVEDGYVFGRDAAIVLALVGAEDPTVDVTRALARAADSHMVIRDLTEGAITYIKFHGDTVDIPTIEENNMADEAEELTLEELVSLAAEGDEEADAALREACAEFDIDPDEYATWEEVGELLEAAMSEGEPEEEAEEEAEPEPEEPTEPADGWTAAALKNLTLKEVRDIANAAGIEGAKTAPRPDLVKALIAGTGDEPAKATKAAKGKAKPAEGTDDVRALASAILDELVARLSA